MTESNEKTSEKLPISEVYKVIDYVTIFKSPKWWEAIVVFEAYGKRSIGVVSLDKKERCLEAEKQVQRKKSR